MLTYIGLFYVTVYLYLIMPYNFSIKNKYFFFTCHCLPFHTNIKIIFNMIIGHIRHIYITLSVVRIYVTTTTRGRKVKPCGQMQTKRKVLPGVIVLHSLISYVDTKSVLSYDCCILCKIRNILRRDSRIPIVYLTLICKMTHLP